jgi:hypothetical protein
VLTSQLVDLQALETVSARGVATLAVVVRPGKGTRVWQKQPKEKRQKLASGACIPRDGVSRTVARSCPQAGAWRHTVRRNRSLRISPQALMSLIAVCKCTGRNSVQWRVKTS